VISPGSTTAVGALPHRSTKQAAAFSFAAFDVPVVPSLPRRSPAESSIARALVGVPGVALGQYGTLAVDVEGLDPDADVRTAVDRDPFGGLRTFLDHAAARQWTGPVLWQFAGPVSVGIALRRAGADTDLAFAVGAQAIGAHLRAVAAAVEAALPASPQVVVLHEPFLADATTRDFPLSPDEVVDLLSTAMAAVASSATVGVHGCADADLSLLLAAGPDLISIPTSPSVLPMAGYLDRFAQNGGWIAWGAVATAGPIGVTSTRAWHQLVECWRELAARGCDIDRLRAQCLLTPECGLDTHNPAVAERICDVVRDLANKLRGDTAIRSFER